MPTPEPPARHVAFVPSRRFHRGWSVLALGLGLGAVAPAASVPKLQVDNRELPRREYPQLSYKDVVERVAPAVVNIYSTKTVAPQGGPGLFDDPFFRHFFGGAPGAMVPRERQERSLGSGVIVSTDGYIITNSHVVEGAESVRVALPQDQRELDATIVGTDPQTDIAVLRIEGPNLTAATIGDSDKLAVGDVVLALGNPFNVGQTVTIGIASAVSRGGFGIEAYEDFIQTDASINPGNSGGPLVDGLGRVIGINTAILSRSGGNQGVGFAVPINLARHVFEQIAAHGSVTRGFLGVVVQPVTSELARAFNLEKNAGALIADVEADQPAARAGVQAGDVVIEFDGKTVRDARHLQLMVAQKAPNTKAGMVVLREGKRTTLEVTLGEQPRGGLARGGAPAPSGDPNNLFAGLEVQDLDPAVRQAVGVPENLQGVVITGVAPGSPAAEAGLQPGDVILEIDHQPVRSADDAAALSEGVQGKSALLRVWSRGGVAFVVLESPDGK